MADNKEYITQTHDDGAIHISVDVIASIAASAVTEVEGVCGLSTGIGSDLAELLGKKSLNKGIRLTIDEEDAITVDCNVVALYGHSVMDVAKNVQDAVTNAIESTTGLRVAAVNVNVCGISMKK